MVGPTGLAVPPISLTAARPHIWLTAPLVETPDRGQPRPGTVTPDS